MDRKIEVAIIDDHSMIRSALAQALACTGDIEVVAQAGNKQDIKINKAIYQADVILLDYCIPEIDPIQVMQTFKDAGLRVLFFSLHENPIYATKVILAGADGFVLKSDDMPELINAIKAVLKGELFLSKTIRSEVIQRLREPQEKRCGLDSLSEREFGLLQQIITGKSLGQIAELYGISISTVSTHKIRIMKKLNISSNAELMKVAFSNQLLS